MQRLILVLLLAGCAKKPVKPDMVAHANHIARSLAEHPHADAAGLAEKVQRPPDSVLGYLKEENVLWGFPQTPRAHTLSNEEQSLVNETLATLPKAVTTLASKAVAGIYFVDELGSTGWTESLNDPKRRSMLAFDASVLGKDIDGWATEKDHTAFGLGADLRLVLAQKDQSKPGSALRFILLHELGHAIATLLRVYPSTGETPLATPFTELSWRLDNGRFIARAPLSPFPLAFYGVGQPRPASEIPAIYKALSESNFVSLYASTRVEDDFAETFAVYVHTVLLGQPYVVLIADGATMGGLDRTDLVAKRSYIKTLLEKAP